MRAGLASRVRAPAKPLRRRRQQLITERVDEVTATPSRNGVDGNGLLVATIRKSVVRGSRMPQIDPHNFSVQLWTERWYYEVCSNPAIEAKLEGKAAAAK